TDGKVGTIVWIMRSPYVFVGGRLEVEGSGAKWSLSWDGKSWTAAGSDLDKLFPPYGPARYEYHLRCELGAGDHLRRLGIVNDLQMAPLALPAMAIGENKFIYTDQSAVVARSPDRATTRVRITHDWVERSASRPPEAPSAPVFPTNGAEVAGTE